MANAVAFFARMNAFVHWQGGGCGDNDGSNVLKLVAARVGSEKLGESGRGGEEEAVTRGW